MLVSALLQLAIPASISATCLHSRADPALPFGYSLEQGPVTWAGIPAAHGSSADWSVCRLGTQQSPAVLYSKTATQVRATVKIPNVAAGKAELLNLNTTLEVPAHSTAPGSLQGSLSYAGKTYALQQFHFHTPSEHRIDDEYYPLEMHLVFKSSVGASVPIVSCLTLSAG